MTKLTTNYHSFLEESIRQIQKCLINTMPGNNQEGDEDLFILYPTMKPIAEICNSAIKEFKPHNDRKLIKALRGAADSLDEAARDIERYSLSPVVNSSAIANPYHIKAKTIRELIKEYQ